MNLLEIPEVARLHERMMHAGRVFADAPEPEPAFLGLSHRKMRRILARIRAGKYKIPPGELTAEQIAEAMERMIRWEEAMKFVQTELLGIQAQFEALRGAAEARALDGAIKMFHAAKEIAKEKGPDSDAAKAVEVMARAGRESYPRPRKRGAGKGEE